MKIFEIASPRVDLPPPLPWKVPDIGWWLDKPIVTFYHGTHIRNVPWVLKNGLVAPESGPTAGRVSLAIEPYTGRGYASMSGGGGESEFRSAGAKPVSTPMKDRAVFVLQIPQSYFVPKMDPSRGNMGDDRDKLTNKDRYLQWHNAGKTDIEYYAITEVQLPKAVPPEFIVGYMIKA